MTRPAVDRRARDRRSPDRLAAVPAVQALLAVPSPLLLVDPQGVVSLCNDAAAALLGMLPAAVIGLPVDDVIAPHLVVARAARTQSRVEVKVERDDGIALRAGMRCAWFPAHAPRASIVVALEEPHDVVAAPSDEPAAVDVDAWLSLAARSRRPASVEVLVDGVPRRCTVIVEPPPRAYARFDDLAGWCADD